MNTRFILFVLFCSIGIQLTAQLPPEFYDEKYQQGFDFPTGITFDATGRAYVWEKAGRVHIIDTSGQVVPTPLLDISEEVSDWKDHGLMGFCLDNDFLINGHFYLLYALDLHHYQYFGTPAYHPDSTELFQPTIGRVTRYTADPASDFKTIVEGSRKVLLGETITNGIPLLYVYHGLGSLIMGEDRSLLISSGDATSNISTDVGGDSLQTPVTPAIAAGILTPDQDVGSYRSQYLGNYNGKILRIDPDSGDGLASNPFFDPATPRSPRSRIWAYGFRNPYRMITRPESGSHYLADGQPGVIYVGDVGNGAWEELNIVENGGENFGWPITEGLSGNWSFQNAPVPLNQMAPNSQYNNGACGAAYFNFREVFTRPQQNRSVTVPNPCRPGEPMPAAAFPSVESLPAIVWNNSKWNKDGKAAIPAFNEEGLLRSIPLDAPDSPVEGDLFNGFSSLAGVFYAGDSFPEEYQGKYFGVDFSGWIRVFDFDGSQQLRSVKAFHDQATDIIHLALNPVDGALYYVNLQGEVHRISYGGNPAPIARIEADQYYGPSPLSVQFDGTKSYDESGDIVSYHWDFGDGSTSTEAQPAHTFSTNSNGPKSFEVRLRVSDEEGATQAVSVIVSLNNSPPSATISSVLPGERYPTKETTVLRLAADVADQEDKPEALTYEWRVFFHHNDHFHPEPVDFKRESFLVINPLGCGQEVYYYRVVLKVTDTGGLSTTDERIILPHCGDDFVGLLPLEASALDNSIVLDWATDFESAVTEMIVQRSSDFFHFMDIGQVDPVGNSTNSQHYQFEDLEPLRGNNVYRIKARQDGTYTYTNLASVAYPKPPDVQVFPNPATGFFKVKVQTVNSEQLRFELYTSNGRRVLQTTWPAKPGDAFEYQMLTDELAQGMYFYRLFNGTEEAVGKILVR